MDALVVSRHPRALFISSCSQSTSSERVLVSIPGLILGCRAAGTLVTSGVSNARVGGGEWLMRMASLGQAACGDTCWEVVTGRCVAKTGLSDLSESFPLMVIGVTRATDGGLLRVLSPEAGLEVSSTIHNKSS